MSSRNELSVMICFYMVFSIPYVWHQRFIMSWITLDSWTISEIARFPMDIVTHPHHPPQEYWEGWRDESFLYFIWAWTQSAPVALAHAASTASNRVSLSISGESDSSMKQFFRHRWGYRSDRSRYMLQSVSKGVWQRRAELRGVSLICWCRWTFRIFSSRCLHSIGWKRKAPRHTALGLLKGGFI